MEEEILDRRTNVSLPCKANIGFLQEETPHHPHVLAVPKGVIQIFLRLPTKNITERPHKQSSSPNKPIKSVHMTKQNLSNKKPDFLRNLNPPNHIEHRLPSGRGTQQQSKEGFTRKPLTKIQAPNMDIPSPLPKVARPQQRKKRGNLHRFPIGQITTEPKRERNGILRSHQKIRGSAIFGRG